MTNSLFVGGSALRLTHLMRLLLLIMVLAVGSMRSAQASHFRYGNISWQPVASDPTGKTIQFKVSVAFRRTFYNPLYNVGDVANLASINFGDGSSINPGYTVTSVNLTDDWFFAEATFTHVYVNTGNFTVSFTGCCRISTLENNADDNYGLNTVVNVGSGNRSPVATIIPILNVPSGQPAAVAQVAATDPDGNVLTYSLAVPADLPSQAGFVQPTGLSVNAATGQLTFNTVGKLDGQLYNAVVKISDGSTAVFVDLIVRIGSGAGSPPTFVYTNNATPANGSVIIVTPGTPVSFSVTAIDTDPGSITLNAAGLPAGSMTMPALQTDGNPVSTVFSWTPTALGSSVLVFTATDPTANQASTSVTIRVEPSVANLPPVCAGLMPAPGTVGVPFSLSLTGAVTDPNGDALTYSYATTPLPAGLSLSGNVISGTPSTTVGSPVSVTVTATDPGQLSATCVVQFTINPAVVSTGCGSPTATLGQPLQLLAPTYVCNGNGSITFNVVGGDGSPIEYQGVPGVSVNGQGGWNTSCIQLVDAEIRTAGDAPVMALQARQNGIVVTYNWDIRAACPVNRPGNENQSPGIVNPIPDQTATEGQAFSYTFPSNTFIDPDGDPMTYTATGLPHGLSFAGQTFSGTPMMSGAYSITVTATDGSILSGFDVFILTVNPAGGMPAGFAITGVNTIACNVVSGGERQLIFNPQYSGLNGQAITFSVVNESLPTTAPGPYTLRLYTDNPTVTLKASQNGTPGEATFSYNWLAVCAGSARIGVEPSAGLTVKILGNPVLTETADVEIHGAAGQPLHLQMLDGKGYSVHELTIRQAGAVERATLRLGQSAGMYFLKATTDRHKQVVKIVKQ